MRRTESGRRQQSGRVQQDHLPVLREGEAAAEREVWQRAAGGRRVRDLELFTASSWSLTSDVLLRINERADGTAIQQYLDKKTGQWTVPNIFIST